MSCLGVRRQKGICLYDGPLAYAISMLVSLFGSKGFALTSPVFDNISDVDGLRDELTKDVHFGFVGKTAIHPSQIDIIQTAFSVEKGDLEAAEEVLKKDAKAVFKFSGSMLEPATHTKWAERIRMRVDHYGVKQDASAVADENVFLLRA